MNQAMTIPNYVNLPVKVFKNAEHYKTVYSRLINVLYANGKQSSITHLYKGIEVVFSQKCKSEEIIFDIKNSKLVLIAPKRTKESPSSLKNRRMQYLTQLLPASEGLKTVAISHIYLALEDKGREELSKSQRKTSKKRKRKL